MTTDAAEAFFSKSHPKELEKMDRRKRSECTEEKGREQKRRKEGRTFSSGIFILIVISIDSI